MQVVAFGLPHISQLWFDIISKGMLPVETFCYRKSLWQMTILSVNKLILGGGWHLHALKGKVQPHHPRHDDVGSCIMALWSVDGHFGLLVRTENRVGFNGIGREVCEWLRRRMIDVHCLLEVRWRGEYFRDGDTEM